MTLSLSILVCSRNGGEKLQRLLKSIATQDAEIGEMILLDDGSGPPLPQPSPPWRFTRNTTSKGYIASRNRLAQMATCSCLLFLDDDVILDDPTVLRRAVNLMSQGDRIGAVAFRQRDVDGNYSVVQPKSGSQIPNYFGWAHAIRRSAWLEAGPFLEVFEYGYEEVEFSLRLLDAGYTIVGDPMLSVIHDGTGNSKNWHHRHFLNERNRLLTVLLRYPARTIPSWLKSAMLNLQARSSEESPFMFRLRLFLALIRKIRYIISHRKPVSKQAYMDFWRLHDEM